jgi:cytochrome b subunit of formate dehydrogenase/mono/diheme cytochrome c family protein
MAESSLPTRSSVAPDRKQNYFTRFNRWQRVEHALLLVSFTTLAVTGLPQKFAAWPVSEVVIGLFGGIESTRVIHRAAAIVLMALSIYHVMAVLYRILVKRVSLSMFPVVEDFKHLFHDILYYLGRRKRKAYYGRYSYAEKAEYLAVVWGTLIMIITGFIMWNPIAAAQALPGEVIPAAKVAHGGEALLAVLAIILWHFYHVHLRHFNKSMFTGRLSRDEMEHEHPAELAMIESGRALQDPPPGVLSRRRRIFYPVAAVFAAVSGFLLFQFVTFEKTAIDTVPRGESAQVFVPQTPTPAPTRPPTSTPPPATPTSTPGATGPAPQEVAWAGGIDQIVSARCAACHIQSALGGLSLATYADALQGGGRGPAVVPGDPDASVLLQIQSAGGHAGQLTDDEFAVVVAWIESGAPELAGGDAPAVGTPGSVWTDDIDQILAARCAACHVQSSLGGLSLATYEDALQGGGRGAAIVPGDVAASVLVTIQSAGGHAGQLTDEELARIIAWIEAGAPEK